MASKPLLNASLSVMLIPAKLFPLLLQISPACYIQARADVFHAGEPVIGHLTRRVQASRRFGGRRAPWTGFELSGIPAAARSNFLVMEQRMTIRSAFLGTVFPWKGQAGRKPHDTILVQLVMHHFPRSIPLRNIRRLEIKTIPYGVRRLCNAQP